MIDITKHPSCEKCGSPLIGDYIYVGREEWNYRTALNQKLMESAQSKGVRIIEFERALIAALHALRSFQYGNSSTEFAKAQADAIEATLSWGEKTEALSETATAKSRSPREWAIRLREWAIVVNMLSSPFLNDDLRGAADFIERHLRGDTAAAGAPDLAALVGRAREWAGGAKGEYSDEGEALIFDLCDALSLVAVGPLPEAWAVVDGGQIDIRTVSPTRKAAIVNWLFTARRLFITDARPDGEIEATWLRTCGTAIVQRVAVSDMKTQ